MDSIEWKEGKIINTPLEGQMKNSYIDYAMSVIVTAWPRISLPATPW